jgi:hypothetical protein
MRRLLAAGVAAVLAVAFALTARAVLADPLPDTPQATVRDFLSAALVEQNPTAACGYLTPRARKSFEPGQDCATFFSALPSTSNRRLDRLRITTRADGRARIVRAGRWSFVLRPASAEALSEFQAPPTDWRIDSGVAALMGRA